MYATPRLFQSSPARGGGCNGDRPVPTSGYAAVSILTRPWGRVQRYLYHEFFSYRPTAFQSSPARGGGCNPYPQHTPSASVVASGWSVGREWGWIQMEQMERQFGKSHLRRAFWGFFGSICSICSICSMRRAAPRKNPPQATLAGGVCVERGTERSYANGSSSSEGVRRRIPRQQRNRLFSRRALVGR